MSSFWDSPPDPPRLSPRARRLLPAVSGGLTAVLLLVLAGCAYLWTLLQDAPSIPDTAALNALNRPPALTFLDRNGAVIAVRGPLYGAGVKLDRLPRHVTQAFLAAEDRRFYRHGGLDMIATVRALKADVSAGAPVQGASTITQQLTRDLFLDRERTLKRKVQEASLSLKLEQRLSKDEILALYLDRIYLGRGAYGLAAGAQAWFGKPPEALTLAEAATLAALVKAPGALSPERTPQEVRGRVAYVLQGMIEEGWATQAEADAALRAALPLAPRTPRDEGSFGWALDRATAEARARLPEAPVMVVRLTLDADAQAKAAAAVEQTLAAHGRAKRASQAALVALSEDGAIRALIGGRDYRSSPFDRATQARRQPGSAFKPFVWAAAMEAGAVNRGGSEAVLKAGLARSDNGMARRLLRVAGRANVASLATRFGVSGLPERPYPSIALGAYEVTALDITSAYQVFQNGGQRVPPRLIDEITDSRGTVLWRHEAKPAEPVFDQDRSDAVVRMMAAVVTQGTARRADFGRPAAGKTGTSQNYRDAWFVGFTPDIAAGVWVGNDDGRYMRGVTGGELPAEIWRRFMQAAHEGLPVRTFRAAPIAPPVTRVLYASDASAADHADPEEIEESYVAPQPRVRRIEEPPRYAENRRYAPPPYERYEPSFEEDGWDEDQPHWSEPLPPRELPRERARRGYEADARAPYPPDRYDRRYERAPVAW